MDQKIYIKDYDTYVNIPEGSDMGQVQEALKKQFPSKAPSSVEPDYKGFFSGMKERLGERGGELYERLHAPLHAGGETTLSDKALRFLSTETGVIGDFAAEALKKGFYSLSKEAQASILGSVKDLVNTPVGQSFISAAEKGGKAYEDFKSSHPMVADMMESLGDIVNVLGLAPAEVSAIKSVSPFAKGGADIAKSATTEAVNVAKDAVNITQRAIGSDIKESIAKEIKQGFDTGIKPSIKGIKNFGNIEKLESKAVDGIVAVAASKGDMGGLPKSVEELSEQVGKLKKGVWEQVEELTKQAGQSGETIDFREIANEVLNVATDDDIMKLPGGIASYAEGRAYDLIKGKTEYSLSDAQKFLTKLNSQLSAFYENPTPDGVQKLWVEHLIADNLRERLNTVIESKTGAQFKDLKKLYGSLSAIEPAISKRAIVFGRRSVKGIPDYIGNTVTATHAIRGLATGDPVAVAQAIAAYGSKVIMKNKNNADMIVSKMMKNVDSLIERSKPFKAKSKIGTSIQETINPPLFGGIPYERGPSMKRSREEMMRDLLRAQMSPEDEARMTKFSAKAMKKAEEIAGE